MAVATLEGLAQLLNYCESFARRMLADSGEFYPFGAFLDPDGRMEALGGYTGTERPDSQAVYRLLVDGLASMKTTGKLTAYALAANVGIPSQFKPPFPDGIRVHVEGPGFSRHVYIPYRCLPYRGVRRFLAVLPTVEYAEPITVDIPPQLFPER